MASNLKQQAAGSGATAPDQGGHGGQPFDASAEGVRRRAERRAEDRARHATSAFTEAQHAAPSGEMPEALQDEPRYGWQSDAPPSHTGRCQCQPCRRAREQAQEQRTHFLSQRLQRAQPRVRQMPDASGRPVELTDQFDVHHSDRDNDPRMGLYTLHEVDELGDRQSRAHIVRGKFVNHVAHQAALAAFRQQAVRDEKARRRYETYVRVRENGEDIKTVARDLGVRKSQAYNYRAEGEIWMEGFMTAQVGGYQSAVVDKDHGTITAL